MKKDNIYLNYASMNGNVAVLQYCDVHLKIKSFRSLQQLKVNNLKRSGYRAATIPRSEKLMFAPVEPDHSPFLFVSLSVPLQMVEQLCLLSKPIVR